MVSIIVNELFYYLFPMEISYIGFESPFRLAEVQC